MKYILKTVDTKLQITEEEYKSILEDIKNNKRFIFIKSLGQMIQVNAIMQIYPENRADEIEDKKKQVIGILHDGTRVRKEFGRWVVDREKYNINGHLLELEYPSPKDYPEIAKECVISYERWEKIKNLSTVEKLKIILGNNNLLSYGKFKKSN